VPETTPQSPGDGQETDKTDTKDLQIVKAKDSGYTSDNCSLFYGFLYNYTFD
jgi:hypothetical protein